MTIQHFIPRFGLALALALVLSLPADTFAQQVNYEYGHNPDRIVIRRTIPNPHAVKRSPLTSDRLSTTSTRYIDARRGFRPCSSVFGGCASHHRYAAYDDHFGISRPENRPWSYSQRTPRSYITQFRNDRIERPASSTTLPRAIVVREQLREDKPKVDLRIRIHSDRSAVPTTSGAVLITSDGTVIQVGD